MFLKQVDTVSKDKELDNYNITLNEEELNTINVLVNIIDKSVISKKQTNSKYTLLKINANSYFLIGHGQREKNQNAFFGEGAYGKVKIGTLLNKNEHNKYQLSDEIYLVKIYKKDKIDLEKTKNESYYFKKLYDSSESEIIESDDHKKIYLIMTRLPGVDLDKINYGLCSSDELRDIIVASSKAISEMHEKGIFHNDIKGANCKFDVKSNKVYFFDFGYSDDQPTNQDINSFKTMILDEVYCYLFSHVTNRDFVSRDNMEDIDNEILSKVYKLVDTILVDKDSCKIKINPEVENKFREGLNDIFSIFNKQFELSEQYLDSVEAEVLAGVMYKCILSKNITIFETILSYCQKNLVNYEHILLFLIEKAFEVNDAYFIKSLISSGVDVSQILSNAINKSELNSIELLVNYVANINLQSENGKSSLMIAALLGQADLVEFLLKKNAEVNLQDISGKTALMYAVEGGHTKIALSLIEKGANLDIKDTNGIDVKQLAEIKGDNTLLKSFRSYTSRV